MEDKGFINRRFDFLSDFIDPKLIRSIVKPAALLVGLNVMAAGFVFTANWLLVRSLGEINYGNYVIFNLWLTLLSVLCLFGMDDFMTVQIPKLTNFKETSANHAALLFWALKICFFVITLVLLVLFCLQRFDLLQPVVSEHFFWFCLLLPVSTVILIVVNFFRAMNQTLTGQVADKAIRPFFFLAGCAAVYIFSSNAKVATFLSLQFFSLILAIGFLAYQLIKRMRFPAESFVFDRSGKTNFTFVSISMLNIASSRLDLFVLERFVLPSQIGHYNIAARIGDLVAFPVIGLNLLIPVIIARVFYQNKRRLRHTLKTFAFLTTGITILALSLVAFIGLPLLSFFGQSFRIAYPVLLMLCVSQVFAAWASPYNALLIVGGKQRYALLSLGIFAGLALVLCLFLVPDMGLNGAALSMLIGQAVYAGAVSYFAFTKAI
jgi:O-antigen/teichoic acid export membrane protein